MLKRSLIVACILTIISFTAASSKFNTNDDTIDSQIVLKSIAEFRQLGHLYEPLRIYTVVVKESFNNDVINTKLQSVLDISAKILSDLLLTKHPSDKIRLRENNQCTDILFGQIIQSVDIEADFAIFAVNNKEKDEIIASKKCEVNEKKTLKSMALEINAEKLMKLDELSQVKEICIAISNALYEDNEGERQVLLSELGRILSKEREANIVSILGACTAGVGNCVTCDSKRTNCVTCANAYYVNISGTCTACNSNCGTCTTAAGNCVTCSDLYHMSAAPTCACNANSALSGNTCVCNAGYVYSGSVCVVCNANCATCTTSATSCGTCSDPTHQTSVPSCACKSNSSLSGTVCVCNAGYYYVGTVCTACSSNCATCSTAAWNCATCSDPNHMSAAPACDCNFNSALSGTTCVCNAGYFYSYNVCTACNSNCGTCTISAATCATCSDPNHMSAAPACACNANSSLSGATCVCNVGYFYSNNFCTTCNTNCATCATSAANCDTCADPTHMSFAPACTCNANSALVGSLCVCNAGYFYSNNVCIACNVNCATCHTSAGNCDTCSDPNHMSAVPACACNANSSLSGTTCVCNTGYFYLSNVCIACSSNCATCTTSAGNCVTCSDPNHMSAAPACACNANSALSGTTCVCNAGYFYSNNVCIACNTNCATCTTAADNCVTCSDPNHMSAAPACACNVNSALTGGLCVCNNGYYFSTNNQCSACAYQCATCMTNSYTCETCTDTIHATSPPNCYCPNNAQLIAGYCVCNAGFFWSSNTVCSTCNMNCAQCTTYAANCVSCTDPIHMSAAPTCACPANSIFQLNTCVCKNGYYYTSNTVCSPCSPQCAACTAISGNCLTCIDTTHMSAAPACACPAYSSLIGTTCTCNAGYFYSSNVICSPCNPNCATCSINAKACSSCIDTTHMSAAPTCSCPANSALYEGSCYCNAGYFYSSNTVCSACQAQCATCINTPYNCFTCTDTTHMSAAPACACPENSVFICDSCVCNTGYYYSSNTVCSACTAPCSACSNTATTCTACEDGYYLNGNTCSPINCSCQAPCATCSSSATTCVSCEDSDNMTLSGGVCVCNDPNASFSTFSNTCVCNEGYLSDNGVCTSCNCPCDNSSKENDEGCKDGYWFNGKSCEACTPPCSKCSTSGTQCDSCVNGAILDSTTNTCSCIDPNSSFNHNSGACICNNGFYENRGVCICIDHNAYFDQVSKTCECNQGYFMSSSGRCQLCQPPCAQCLNSPAFCVVCDDFANMNLNTTTGTCACKESNALFNPWFKACQVNLGYNCNQNAPIVNYLIINN